MFVRTYINFYASTRQHISQTSNPQIRRDIEEYLEVSQMSAIQILQNLKPSGTDPSHIQAISLSTRQLADSVGRIVASDENVEAAWVREADQALRQISAVRPILQQPALAPLNENSYYESLEAVTEQAKRLGDGMSGMVSLVLKLS